MRPLLLGAILLFTVLLLAGCTKASERESGETPAESVTPRESGETLAESPTPVPELRAAFMVNAASGPAPLFVQFTNQSINAERLEWDFGDGEKSNERDPVHRFTKSGRYQVKLTAFRTSPGGEVTDTSVMPDEIDVTPGRLAKLVVSPATVRVEPGETVQLTVRSEDEFENAIPGPEKRWIGSPEANILPGDVLQAGTKAGRYPQGVRLEAVYLGGSAAVDLNIEIIPGPVSSATVTPAQTSPYTGDSVAVTTAVFDRFGNAIPSPTIIWVASDGSISGSGSTATFRSGRIAKPVTVSAQVSDGRSSVTSSTQFQIRQGTCQLSQDRSRWVGHWYPINSDGSPGGALGSVSYDLGINISTWGGVYGGRGDRVMLDATAQVLVERTGPVWFQIAGDDGFQLLVDNQVLIDEWRSGRLRTIQRSAVLSAGLHALRLKYFEDVGEAILRFSTDSKVVSWNRASTCTGSYTQIPSVDYFLVTGTNTEQVAERFGVTPGEVSASVELGTYLTPGTLSVGPTTKIIFLQGMGSRSGCDDIASEVASLYSRMLSVLSYAQSSLPQSAPYVKAPDFGDLVGFSYKNQYSACSIAPFGQAIELPRYEKDDTCIGVELAARYLDALVSKTRAANPSARIVLIGHSLGGLVATYWASSVAPPDLSSSISAIVTVDSPLRGDTRAGLVSNCVSTSRTVQDLDGRTSVVSTLATIRNQALLSKTLSITTSSVGSAISGSWAWAGSCTGTAGTTLAATTLGALFCPLCAVIGLFGGYVIGESAAHSCAFSDDQSLLRMAAIVNGGFPQGFQRQPRRRRIRRLRKRPS